VVTAVMLEPATLCVERQPSVQAWQLIRIAVHALTVTLGSRQYQLRFR
jgi:hypothetical protein